MSLYFLSLSFLYTVKNKSNWPEEYVGHVYVFIVRRTENKELQDVFL